MIKAIETEYNGQKFKSRLEANMARILNLMGYNWKYEPKSFLLDNGVHYQPDFFVPRLNLWIETRGYSNNKGNKQIEGFKKRLFPNQEEMGKRQNSERNIDYNPDFLIVGPDEVKFCEDTRRFGLNDAGNAWISRCTGCGSLFFYGLSGSYQCRNCGEWSGDHHLGKSCAIYFDSQESQILVKKQEWPKLSEWIKEKKSGEDNS